MSLVLYLEEKNDAVNNNSRIIQDKYFINVSPYVYVYVYTYKIKLHTILTLIKKKYNSHSK